MSISQYEYEVAKQKVEQFEKRQKQLDHVKNELTKHIRRFSQIKFRVDKDTKTVFFAGLYRADELKVGVAKAKNGDVFDVNIGKLIAIKKSIGENTRDVENLVENVGETISSTFADAFATQLASCAHYTKNTSIHN